MHNNPLRPTGRLKYTGIEYGGMFISVKKKDILERSTLPLFEMPCTKIRRIGSIAGKSGWHRPNNSQLARHFKLSRNTVTKWKKLFL